jgi:isoquinoline 1-oxidoreductase subunit beta
MAIFAVVQPIRASALLSKPLPNTWLKEYEMKNLLFKSDQASFSPARRNFLKVSAVVGGGALAVVSGGLLLEMSIPGLSMAEANASWQPNAFLRIDEEATVTVIIKHLEMGQGTYTGLATLVAEELDADWAQIRVEGAPANAKLYNNLLWGTQQGTGGSTAIANAFQQMRQAGATARQMLVAAAAEQWQVDADSIEISNGRLSASGHTAGFGELAAAAAKQPLPLDVELKDPKDFRLIGKEDLVRKDNIDKTQGTAIYTQDIFLPNMLTALVAHPPRFGAKLKSYNADTALKIPGVKHVVKIPTGVAVVATDFWSAKRARDALSIEWDESEAFKLSSDAIMAQYKKKVAEPGAIAAQRGNLSKGHQAAKQTLSASFEFPYLAHATMEPMNCVVDLHSDACDLYYGVQMHTGDQMAVAQALNMKPEQVRLHMLYAGGSFGRRANPKSDYVLEAVDIAKAIKVPVKLVWTREDDMRAGYYRPMYYHTIEAGVDQDGNISHWHWHIVGQSLLAGTPFEAFMVKNGVDHTSVEGAANLPYQIANFQVELHTPTNIQVPVLWWRSVGSTHTAYAGEVMIDQLAKQAAIDPVTFRLKLLEGHPRHQGVLKLAAEKAGWGKPLEKGLYQGVAVHESFNSYVAEVATVRLNDDGSYQVEKVVCAVDCGIAVNPDIIRAQMEGGIGFGLSALLSGRITLDEGRVVQSNFHDYTVLRMNQTPDIEVHIVPSGEAPTGVGEPGTPPIAPAVANALYAATGKHYGVLPLEKA